MIRSFIVSLVLLTISVNGIYKPLVPSARQLNNKDGLCNTFATAQDLPSDICSNINLLSLDNTIWQPCCAFKTKSDMPCRTYEITNPRCFTKKDLPECLPGGVQGANTCDNIDKSHTLTIKLEFKYDDSLDCCKSCTCYGDPECVSFDGIEDLWIPCDARKLRNVEENNDCKMYKETCEEMPECEWISRKDNSKNRDFPLEGSPCIPKSTLPNSTLPPLKMTMINLNKGAGKVDLTLGERGVIKAIDMNFDKKYSITAEDCFDKSRSGVKAWKANGQFLESRSKEGWARKKIDEGLISWSIKDSNSSVLVRFICLRSVKPNGLPRINVQEVAVDKDQNGNGFCFTGNINEADKKLPYIEKSTNIHQTCTQNQTDSLQACKHLVEFGSITSQLEDCGKKYCDSADVKDRDDCKDSMGEGKKVEKWIDNYCEAVLRNPKNLETRPKNIKDCKKFVNAEGWGTAVYVFGNGYKTIAINEQTNVGTTLDEYEVKDNNFETCEQGVTIEVANEKTGSWDTKYFIPASKPFKDNVMIANGKDHKELFQKRIRIRQCDMQVNNPNKCNIQGSSCRTSVGVTFKLDYEQEVDQPNDLNELYKKNVLKCVDKMINGTISNTWCFSNDDNYVPIDEVCPCRPGRGRLLSEEADKLLRITKI